MLRIVLMCLALPGCAALTKISTGQVHNISPTTVYEMEAAYTVGPETLIAGYRRLPSCKHAIAPCHDPAIAAKLSIANRLALKALRDLENFARTHPTLDATALIIAAQLAIGNATALSAQYGRKA